MLNSNLKHFKGFQEMVEVCLTHFPDFIYNYQGITHPESGKSYKN